MSFKDLYDPDFEPRGAGESESEDHWKPIERDRRDEEIQWFIENIDCLEKHRETIVDDPELYGVPLESAGVDTTLTVPYNLNLGPILELWNRGDFVRDCPECGNQAYVVYACGSPLSGSHSWGGFCRDELKPVSASNCSGLGELYYPLTSFYQQRKTGKLVNSNLELKDVIQKLDAIVQ